MLISLQMRFHQPKAPPVPIRRSGKAKESVSDDEEVDDTVNKGDPTDGGPDGASGTNDTLKQMAIEACTKNWKAAQADKKKTM